MSVATLAKPKHLRTQTQNPKSVLPPYHTDNGTNLNNKMITELCQQFKIQHHNSAPYRPKMNGAVEAPNKNIKKIVKKMTVTYKDWHEMVRSEINT